MLIPAAAAVVHGAVRLAHYAAAEKLEQVDTFIFKFDAPNLKNRFYKYCIYCNVV